MDLNSDFSQRAVVHAAHLPWVASPIPGVERRMLDRVGDEIARATSIVRYAPGSRFSPHVHYGGEEFFVLDGVFQDEHADFPAGSYIRNPPQTQHSPGSEQGCMIFVKLWQFDLDDRTAVSIDTNEINRKVVAERDGVTIIPLFRDVREDVRLEHWPSNAEFTFQPQGGLELLVLSGAFTDGEDNLVEHSWLRLPVGAPLQVSAGSMGCRVWVKEGHLRLA
ncbi:MAG: cupin domain-containing protein [Pseudomonadota bacterium]|nr:cupin domain-containing protein [Pseudomonadota bacterium]